MKSRSLMLIALVLLVVLATAAHAQFSVLYNLGSKSGDPTNPQNSGIIAQGRDGNLYSTTPQGQETGCFHVGEVFKITPTGTLTVINCSAGSEGATSGVTLGTDGNFYGTSSGGGIGPGSVFKMTPSGTLTTLYSFTNQADGCCPTAPPIQGTDGNFYGTASNGNQGKGFFGSVYKITPSGTLTVFHTFIDSTDGAFPHAPLVQGNDGNFYGTAEAGDSNNGGTVFKVTPLKQFFPLFDFAQSSHWARIPSLR